MHNRGQTNVLGYVTVIGIVVTMLIFLNATGGLQLSEVTEDAKAGYNEQAMKVFDKEFRDVIREGETAEKAIFNIKQGEIQPGNKTTIRVDVGSDGDIDAGPYIAQQMDYRNPQKLFSYEFGGIVRKEPQSGGEYILTEPLIEQSGNTAWITIPHGNVVGGSDEQIRSVAIITPIERKTETFTATGNTTITLLTTPRNANAWKQYFEVEDKYTLLSTTNPTEGRVSFTINADQVVITEVQYRIQIQK